MRAVIQRVSQAEVKVDGNVIGKIKKGLVVLLGVEDEDTEEDVRYLVRKISSMRIFEDEEEKMNRSISDIGGALLSISQFTLHADTKKGNRPSFTGAAGPARAKIYYDQFNSLIEEGSIPVQTGEFGAHMEVSLINDGPVTILIDSKNK
ncbi:D-tyrosyl-tRNA(Tyr) deacylase [Alkalibacterium sp. AK22]|uniref:D-aminoacyl-tRNA deacylase n=1 Tax=Alkalibacterium sp. AK22 TaxID=1229520 RepID=UPI00044F65E7|nr:D-aminoacyl-tRNA deacylase [Alkalibacterium sp. AK22]EXJ24114.1 D-tyrosyl-tRNA(Tyr) deacylase [Alkalibacterium sp. AK22]